jgi:signal transduction histidine kinase
VGRNNLQPLFKSRIALRPARKTGTSGVEKKRHESLKTVATVPFTIERVFIILRWLVIGLALLLQLYLMGDGKNPDNLMRAIQVTALVAVSNGVLILLRLRVVGQDSRIWISIADAAVNCLAIGFSGGIYSPFLVLVYLIVVEASFDFTASNALTFAAGVGIMFVAATMFLSRQTWNELHLTIVMSEVMAMLVFVSVGSSMMKALEQQREVARREKALAAQLNHQVKALSALNRLSERLNATLELEELMQKTVETLPTALEVDACVAFLTALEQNGSCKVRSIWFGVDEAFEPAENVNRDGVQIGPLVLSLSELEMVVEKGQILCLGRENSEEAVLMVPLRWDDRDSGGLAVLRQNGPVFGDSDRELVSALGRQMALLIKNAHLYELERQNVLRLQELEQLKSDFLSVVSHELRTPLTSIKASTILMLSRPPDEVNETVGTLLRNVDRNTDRLNSLVNDLLDMAKLQNGRLKLSIQTISPVDIVQDVVSSIRPLTDRKGQKLLVDSPPTLPPIIGDRRRIEQILTNLLSNANRYTEPEGEINVKVKFEQGQLLVSVRDNGPGIDVKEQELIFERFYRARQNQGSKIGTGLGLSIAKSLVELHGGRIWVESEPGQGSTFYFTLPVQVNSGSTDDRELLNARNG